MKRKKPQRNQNLSRKKAITVAMKKSQKNQSSFKDKYYQLFNIFFRNLNLIKKTRKKSKQKLRNKSA